MLRKPHWLSAAQWTELIERQPDRIPRCVITGETDDLTVDHRVPRYNGGTDDIDNLQFMKRMLNIRKGIKPDKYWSQSFFFDQVPMLNQCRAAQRGLYNTIMSYANWFSQSTSDVSRLLYTYAMVVGAGKTIGTLTAACAYNQIIRAKWGAARRADRILILCKERAIRDQFVIDLREEPVKYGIFPTPLKVKAVERGAQFDDEAWLQSLDVVVSCIQQLWEGRSLPRLLHYFPVIFVDEPHYAIDQVYNIVEQATTSVCFGGTGSPMDGIGKLLDRMIRLYTFTYQDADEQDRSVKFLDSNNWYKEHIRIAKLDEAETLDAGQITLRSDTGAPGYDKNFEPAKSVVLETVRHMERCDKITDPLFATKAPHRKQYACDVENFYPVHALICCDSVRFAEHLAQATNAALDKDRKRFPLSRGWYARVVHCEGDEPDGRKRPDKPLKPDHPWLRCYKLNGRLDGQCARILFVVGMGREGVNNPYCGVVGITSDHASQIEVIQRIIGRQIRSIVINNGNGHWSVPPAELDTITIITHEVFAPVLGAIEDGINFIVNMESKLESLRTIDNLEAGDSIKEREHKTPESSLPFKDKLDIAGMIGIDPNVDDDLIVQKISKGNSGSEGPVVDFIERVRTNPADVARAMRVHRGRELSTLSTVLWEAIVQNPNDEQLTNFVRCNYPRLANGPINDQNRPWAQQLFEDNAAKVSAATPPLLNPDNSVRDIDQVRKNIGGAIVRSLGHHYIKSDDADEALWSFVGHAVKVVLGVPKEASARKGSQWDIPNCLIILERAEIHRDIQSYVISRLIEAGHCPSLAILHQ